MNEDYEIILNPDGQDDHRPLLTHWLGVLMKIQIASIVLSVIAKIPSGSSIPQWISPLFAVGLILAFFRLTPVNARYRKAAIFRCIALAGTVLALFNINALALVTSVCSIIAVYQEYAAHSEVTVAAPELSRKWHSLFYWQLVVGLVAGFASAAGVVIAVLVGVGAETIVNVAVFAVGIVTVVLQIVYVTYMKKTLELFQA